jgi:hypothetical protein
MGSIARVGIDLAKACFMHTLWTSMSTTCSVVT